MQATKSAALAWLLPAMLAACGGGGGDDAPAAPAVPAIAATVSLDDNHAVGTVRWPDGATVTGGQGQAVDGVACGPVDETYHIHTHLSILVDGQAQAIPAEVGIVNNGVVDCHYGIHTHDHSGKLHVEAAAPFAATLGQVFAIWGQPLARDNVAGITGKPVVVWITENGVVSRHDGDLAAIPLASHRHIAIQLGTPVAQVPFFSWSAN